MSRTIGQRGPGASFAIILWVGVLTLLTSCVQESLARYCRSEDTNPYNHFASKTAYEEVRGTFTEVLKSPGCHPRLFYLIARHGTRYPNKKTIALLNEVLPPLQEDILAAVDDNKAHLCDQDIENLRSWKIDLNESLHYELTPSGQQEMEELASRFKTRIPSIFQRTFVPVPSMFDIKFSDTSRSRDSAFYFLKGLVGEGIQLNDDMKDDRLLRAYKGCSRWQQEVNKNETVQAVINSFINGSEMEGVIEDVRYRLGLENNFTYDTLSLMYEMCRYEKAWDRLQISPWCAFFKKEQLQILEYAEDLKYYIEDGYGYPVTYEQLCLPVQDIVDRFREAMKSESSTAPQIILRFSHSGFLLKLFARLGLYNDSDPLRADNHASHTDRQWQTSLIDPFSANLALVLWSCPNDHQVSAFVNEHEILVPRCTTFPCPINSFLNAYAPVADHCDLDATCALPGQKTVGAAPSANIALSTTLAMGILALVCHCLRP